MKKQLQAGLFAAVMASAALLAPAGLASAATSGTQSDPTNDAPAAVDVTGVSITNSLDTVSVSVGLRNPLPASSDPSWQDNGGANVLVVAVRPNESMDSVIRGFTYFGRGATVGEFESSTSTPISVGICTATTAVSGTTVTFSAAASCFGTPARVDAYGYYGNINGDIDYFISNDIDGNSDWTAATAREAGGQYLLGADGGVFSLGDSQFYGSTGNIRLNQPVVAMAKNPTGEGYWFVARDGGVFTYGPQTDFFGSQGGKPLNQPIVGMAATPSGKGYWLVARDGGIFTFGDAAFFGSTGDKVLNAPIIGMAAAPGGNGYYLYASDGGVFTFGPGARFQGSTGDKVLNQPISSMALTPSGNGYWFVARDGGVFTFGDANFYGSAVYETDGAAAIALLPDASGVGYRIVADNGQVYPFGRIFGFGDVGDQGVEALNAPIVGAVDNP